MNHDHHNSQHLDKDIAYHLDWGFKKDALVWYGVTPVALNFYPLASEFKNWLLQKGQLSTLAKQDKTSIKAITNPYSYNASTIATILAFSINSSYKFAYSTEEISDVEAEVERIRLLNEQVLYSARLCEVAIKQLLYCTHVPPKLYTRAALGDLLSTDCKPCRKAGKPHKISLLGSLAHRYHLCLPFEHCLFEHLKIVNRKRNLEAAHSQAQTIDIRTPEESRAQHSQDSRSLGEELLHMLEHISELEQAVIRDVKGLSKLPYEQWT